MISEVSQNSLQERVKLFRLLALHRDPSSRAAAARAASLPVRRRASSRSRRDGERALFESAMSTRAVIAGCGDGDVSDGGDGSWRSGATAATPASERTTHAQAKASAGTPRAPFFEGTLLGSLLVTSGCLPQRPARSRPRDRDLANEITRDRFLSLHGTPGRVPVA